MPIQFNFYQPFVQTHHTKDAIILPYAFLYPHLTRQLLSHIKDTVILPYAFLYPRLTRPPLRHTKDAVILRYAFLYPRRARRLLKHVFLCENGDARLYMQVCELAVFKTTQLFSLPRTQEFFRLTRRLFLFRATRTKGTQGEEKEKQRRQAEN